ncbi:MAG: hypothetical protein RLZZ502_166 [Pseudomonadota bacterium]|jgi:phosphoribosylaminoimidazolecarboxamide formyltransferase/IMP cyclohydrolase
MKYALLSVSDKTGLCEFAHGLVQLGYGLLSTGGTAQALRVAGLSVQDVSDYTGFPEMLDGRVKTLHPKIHAGILARRSNDAHLAAMMQHGFPYIDMVVVNLYPFAATVAKPDVAFEDAIENIDIGGPAMVRSAAKNFQHVAVVVNPGDYASLLTLLQQGPLSQDSRYELMKKAFAHTAAYDSMISNWLGTHDVQGQASSAYPEQLNLNFSKAQNLRYGENPHQSAALYQSADESGIAHATMLQGKELSYNNLADADAAWQCVQSFAHTACVIVKHANPCGVALGDGTLQAYQKAFACDPTSAFGGIIAFNRPVERACAEAVSAQFLEVLIAPAYSDEALSVLAKKPNVRVLQLHSAPHTAFDLKRIGGGVLIQSADTHALRPSDLKAASRTPASEQQIKDCLFAWQVAKYVKSNAIVFVKNEATVGIGAGQMSRLDSARIAGIKAQAAGLDLAGSAVASDAFFPFRDGLDTVVAHGATAVIQPGGSMRDNEVIAAADEHGVAMLFTGVRHFRH